MQTPIQGVSMMYTFEDSEAKSRHTTQYFEMVGNRGIYHDGWLLGTTHQAPWEAAPRHKLPEDAWELYYAPDDFSLTNDLAAQHLDKVKELQELFLQEAIKNKVLPIDDRRYERFNAAIAGRPDLMGDRHSLTVYEGMTGMMESAFLNVKNRSHSITAEVEIPETRAQGVILCQGGRFGGWSLYMKDGQAKFCYNFAGLKKYTIAAAETVPAGNATIRYEFAYDGGKPGSGGMGTIFVNGTKVAEGRIDHTVPFMFSGDETVDVGVDDAAPVTEDYEPGRGSRFTGKIRKITINLEEIQHAERAEIEKGVNDVAAEKVLIG
ncbi:MAG: hypothetical protein WBE77_11395 [Candidatus Cybelea sp.]